MSRKPLLILALLDAAAVLAFVFYFHENRSFVPLLIGLLPLLLGNVIYVNEVIKAPSIQERTIATENEMRRMKQNAFRLLAMPILYCIVLPSLIRFYGSLGWSPVVCFGFSVLLCIVLISAWGGVKLLLKSRAVAN